MIKKIIVSIGLLVFSSTSFALIANTQTVLAAPCPGGYLLGLPTWYAHLEGSPVTTVDQTTQETHTSCTPQINSINDFWKIVATVLEILLSLASMIAVGFIVYGGVIYLQSQGNPDKTKQAQQTIISAVVGLVISIIAATLVGYLADKF